MNINYKKFVIKLAKDVGEVQLKHFPKSGEIKSRNKTKFFGDIVTKVDMAAEKIVAAHAKKIGYKGKILMEESGETSFGDEDKRLIVDSLDGTFFYSKGFHNFCVAIALEEKGRRFMAVVYNPISDELFFAERGKGTWLNGKKIHVSEAADINRSTIILSAFPNHEIEMLQKIFLKLMTTGGLRLLQHVLNLNLCYTAAGRYDGCIAFYSRLPEWDKFPGMLILEEAGGKITDLNGAECKNDATKFIASNGKLHESLLRMVV